MTAHNSTVLAAPAAESRPARPMASFGGRLGNALWHQRSVRAQLLITIIVIDLVAALVAGGVTIFQTRNSVQVEVAASMKLAELLVREAVQMQHASADATGLPLQLRFLRHVRISVRDPAGQTVTEHPASDIADKGDERETAPAWFAALVASPIERHEFPIVTRGERVGSVLVTSEPRDEIAEAWQRAVAFGTVALALNVVVIGILFVLFGRVLDPIARLAGGLSDLEHRNYDVRLPAPEAHELAAITHRFNGLAQALQTMRAENEQLNQRLITVQDDERRNIALELHDEVGPNLFGLKAAASSIATAAGKLEDAVGRRVAERTREMQTLIEHMQAINRRLLNRLRPMALGHVPLENMLSELARDCARRYPHIAFSFTGQGLTDSYGDSVDLTVYRCTQESLTNAIKHADAKRVQVDVAGNDARLTLSIRDDGQGIDPGKPPGFGVLGMRERVQALGGAYAVESESGRGTCVRIAIPIQKPEARGLQSDGPAS